MKVGRATTGLLSAALTLLSLVPGLPEADGHLASADTPALGMMRRALTSSDVCQAELYACQTDSSCYTCVEVFLDAEDRCNYDTYEPDNCGEARDIFCCSVAEEDRDCESDYAFGELIGEPRRARAWRVGSYREANVFPTDQSALIGLQRVMSRVYSRER